MENKCWIINFFSSFLRSMFLHYETFVHSLYSVNLCAISYVVYARFVHVLFLYFLFFNCWASIILHVLFFAIQMHNHVQVENSCHCFCNKIFKFFAGFFCDYMCWLRYQKNRNSTEKNKNEMNEKNGIFLNSMNMIFLRSLWKVITINGWIFVFS